MGYWGEGLFQNDSDLDVVILLGRHLGVEELYYPDDPEKLRQELDSGKLEAEFRKLRDGVYDYDEELSFYGIKTTIVLLAAVSMRHGATISDEFRQCVKDCLKKRLTMHKRAKDDMRKGIDTYRNGVPLDLAGMGLDEVVATMSDTRSQGGASNPAA